MAEILILELDVKLDNFINPEYFRITKNPEPIYRLLEDLRE
jgi:hypothetical protein